MAAETNLARVAVDIRILISVIAKLSMRDLEQRLTTALPGISLLQYGVMRILTQDKCTLSELSTRMMLTPSTLVPAIDKLEREGLAVRGKDPNDRRRTPLILTDAAHKALASIPPGHPDDRIVRAVEQLGPERARALASALHVLLNAMATDDDRELIETLLANHPERRCTS
jgi:DNA-binding MarR family transcriptional regulator